MALATDFLSYPCKRTDRLDLKTPIARYVLKAYGKERAADILQDIEEVSRRRTEVVAVCGGGPGEAAKEIFASYYRALSVMETRFPISRDGSHAQVPFYWMNALNYRKKTKQTNIHFEKAAVLFNIAAHLSQSAAQQNRESQEGYKSATNQFQEAATVFALVKDVALKVENPKPADLTADFLTMAEKLMLAQGQECVYWKASKDKKSPLLLARLARQASVLYAEALSHLTAPLVREDLDRTWQDLIQSKSWLFEALCQRCAAEDAKAKEDISTEIARLNQTVLLLERLQKNGKFATEVFPRLIKEFVSAATTRLHQADRDNASVYLKKIPGFNELPVISGAQLVKIGTVSFLDASKEHIFEELIPEPITKALSRYSDLVDNIIRKQMDKLNGATDDARVRLKQFELPELLDSVTSASPAMLPDAIKKDLEEIESSGGLAYLEDMLVQLNGLKSSCNEDLEKILKDLDEEAAQDSQAREQYGQQWTVKTSAAQTAGFRKIIASYTENLTNADNSDRVVQTKLKENTGLFALLTVASCIERLPKLEAGMVNTSDLEPQTLVANLRNSLDQLSAMSDERAGLEESLKEVKSKDNLLPKLVATGVGFHEELFRVELQKYKELEQDVAENVKRQEDLFTYIRKALTNFHQTFDIPVWKQKVDQYCKDLKTQVSALYDVRTNLGEGMRFYMNLKTHIDKLKQQTADFVLSRTMEREDCLELLKAREKPTGVSATQTPPSLPAEPPAYTPPPSVPSEGHSVQPSVPPQHPAQAVAYAGSSTASYSVAQEGRSDSGSLAPSAPPSAPFAPPSDGYHPPEPRPGPPVQHDAMVESPNPYRPPPQQQSAHYNQYPPSGQYSHPQYQQQQPPPGPPPMPNAQYYGYNYSGQPNPTMPYGQPGAGDTGSYQPHYFQPPQPPQVNFQAQPPQPGFQSRPPQPPFQGQSTQPYHQQGGQPVAPPGYPYQGQGYQYPP